jgi:signal transduction histidine kinase
MPVAPRSSIVSGTRVIGVVCSSMVVWGVLMAGAFIGLTRLLAIESSPQDLSLANGLLPIVPCSFVVILFYLVFRLLPIRRTLEILRRGDQPKQVEFESAARQAMMMPPFFLVGAAVVSICVSASMFLAGGLVEAREVNVVARLLSIGQVLIIVYGMGSYLMLRGQLRPVLVALMPREVPMKRRFGLRWRMMLWVLLLAAIAVTAVLVIDSQATGRLLSEAGLTSATGAQGSGEWPLLSGAALVAMLLVMLFASATGWRLGLATSEPAIALRENIERMAAGDRSAAIDRLPVFSTTEVGRIAVAFNRLADRLDVEHARLDAYSTQIRQTEQLRSRFLANISHELRTPLNAIIGFSDVLLQGFDGDLNQQQRNAVHIISREGERFLRLIDDILLMAKFEAGRVVLMREEFTIGELLAEALSAAPPPNTEAFQHREDPRLKQFRIQGDRRKLLRALVALLEHAFRTAGDEPVRLELEIASGDRLRFCVVCPSVPPPGVEESERMFEGFRCVGRPDKTTREVGLGLPLARMIAESHQGEVRFGGETEACSLWLSLPVIRAVEEKPDDPV